MGDALPETLSAVVCDEVEPWPPQHAAIYTCPTRLLDSFRSRDGRKNKFVSLDMGDDFGFFLCQTPLVKRFGDVRRKCAYQSEKAHRASHETRYHLRPNARVRTVRHAGCHTEYPERDEYILNRAWAGTRHS